MVYKFTPHCLLLDSYPYKNTSRPQRKWLHAGARPLLTFWTTARPLQPYSPIWSRDRRQEGVVDKVFPDGRCLCAVVDMYVAPWRKPIISFKISYRALQRAVWRALSVSPFWRSTATGWLPFFTRSSAWWQTIKRTVQEKYGPERGIPPPDRIPTPVKLSLLQFACNTSFWGTSLEKFEAHITALSSIHSWDLDNSAHNVAQEEVDDSCAVLSQGFVFVPTDIECVVLNMDVDWLGASVAEVSCRYFGSLFHSPSWSNDPTLGLLQDSSTTWELGAYLEEPIQALWDTANQILVPGSFQGWIAVASLQSAFPVHYLSEPPDSRASSPPGSVPTSTLPFVTLASLYNGGNDSSDNEGDRSDRGKPPTPPPAPRGPGPAPPLLRSQRESVNCPENREGGGG